jgi:hypothetical protein
VLLARRQGALFGGLWDLPENQKLSGVRVHGALEKRGVVEQTLTHREVRVAIHSGRASGTPRGELRWVAPEELPRLGLSSLARKSLRVAGVT